MVYIIIGDNRISIVCSGRNHQVCPVDTIGTVGRIRGRIIFIRHTVNRNVRHGTGIRLDHAPIIILRSAKTLGSLRPLHFSGSHVVPGLSVISAFCGTRFPDIEISGLVCHIQTGVSRHRDDGRIHQITGRCGNGYRAFFDAGHFAIPVNRCDIGIAAGPGHGCAAGLYCRGQLNGAVGCHGCALRCHRQGGCCHTADDS